MRCVCDGDFSCCGVCGGDFGGGVERFRVGGCAEEMCC